jgi:predicted transposase YbfD/YdcC
VAKEVLPLPHGIPSHDTLGRVFRKLDSTELSARLGAWLERLHGAPKDVQICIDGKAIRRALKASGSPVHVVNAWATRARMALGQVEVDSRENEIVAIPKLLGLLQLKGQLVSIDAIGCQREIAVIITEKGGDYLRRVKTNQPNLHEEMVDFFIDAERDGFKAQAWHAAEDTEGDHGRIEIRRTWACEDLSWFADHARWAGLKSVVVQRNTRESKGKTSDSLNIYISSRPAKEVEALARAARGHRAVENSLHWVLDMAFDEDWSRARSDHAALNLAALRRVVVSVVRENKTLKCGAATKRKCAGWNGDDLTQVLLGR